MKSYSGWRSTWDKIIPGEFGGSQGTDLLFYDAQAGLVRIYTTANGSITLLKQMTGWQEWDVILPMSLGGSLHTDLFMYSRTRGDAVFARTDGMGNLQILSRSTFQRNWDQIVPGDYNGDGYTDLFFYHRVLGDGKFYTSDSSGSLTLLRSLVGLRKTWDEIVSGKFGGNGKADLLFYDRNAGEARIAFVDSAAWTLGPLTKTSKFYQRIVTGNFNNTGIQEWLGYDGTHRLRIQAVRCMDADGRRAAVINPTEVQAWVDKANECYSGAGIQFDFDPETDWTEVRDTTLNALDTESRHGSKAAADKTKNLATNYSALWPCKVVVYFRHGAKASATGGGFSSPAASYIAMPGFSKTFSNKYYLNTAHPDHGASKQNLKLFAHEMGHYLGLPHSFKSVDYTGFTDPHAAVLAYMKQHNFKTLADIDGDRHVIWDTPPDLGISYYLLKGWNPANTMQETHLSSSSLGINLRFNTDQHQVMSYFAQCNDYLRLSPDQRRRVREWVHEPHRRSLLDTCSIPGLAKSYGTSCRSGMVHTTHGAPSIGKGFVFRLRGALPNANASMMLGNSKTRWGSLQLPFNLSVIGAPGCYAYTNQILVLGMKVDATGYASVVTAIPNSPSLIGVRAYTQWFSGQPRANALGLVTSNGIESRVGG